MPSLVMTIKKAAAEQPWVTLNDREFVTANFSPNEIETIIDPYHQYVISLPGYVGANVQLVDSTTMVITTTFDTVEHAESAMATLGADTAESIVMAMREQMAALRARLGVEYTYTTVVAQ
jgi:hypothetical protein